MQSEHKDHFRLIDKVNMRGWSVGSRSLWQHYKQQKKNLFFFLIQKEDFVIQPSRATQIIIIIIVIIDMCVLSLSPYVFTKNNKMRLFAEGNIHLLFGLLTIFELKCLCSTMYIHAFRKTFSSFLLLMYNHHGRKSHIYNK